MKITIEGAQGEGKTTAARLLFEALEKHEWLGKRVIIVDDDDGLSYGRSSAGSDKRILIRVKAK